MYLESFLPEYFAIELIVHGTGIDSIPRTVADLGPQRDLSTCVVLEAAKGRRKDDTGRYYSMEAY